MNPGRGSYIILQMITLEQVNIIETGPQKESDGSYMESEGKCMVGRRHNGDENKNTTYTFAHIAVPYVSIVR